MDAICDGEDILIPGIMEHVERTGIHSGDSIAVYPACDIDDDMSAKIVATTETALPGAQRPGAHQLAVHPHGWGDLRHRGEPPGLPHRALHQQGDRRAHGATWPPR